MPLPITKSTNMKSSQCDLLCYFISAGISKHSPGQYAKRIDQCSILKRWVSATLRRTRGKGQGLWGYDRKTEQWAGRWERTDSQNVGERQRDTQQVVYLMKHVNDIPTVQLRSKYLETLSKIFYANIDWAYLGISKFAANLCRRNYLTMLRFRSYTNIACFIFYLTR